MTPTLCVVPDPDTWFIGPEDDRDLDTWLPQAAELVRTTVRGADRPDLQRYVLMVLARIGRPDQALLPYRVIRWLDVDDLPFVATFGMVPRDDAGDGEWFLEAVDGTPVERPIIDEVAAPTGRRVRRSMAWSDIGGGLLVEARYVVDDGDPDALVLVQAANRVPGRVVAAIDDLDRLAASMRVTRG